ncbi:MAG: SpoIIE family protein phosphatase, partial [Oscillospiraceae bacterium]|nr:SpoIIE family protein phosphatase [Oscillospiraceae bacterium]
MNQPEIKERRGTEMLRAPHIKDIGMTMLLILAGRASVLGMFPFGMAFFASCFDKSIAYIGITALSVALMTSAGNYMLVKYLVAALIFWIYTRLKKKNSIVASASWCGGSMFLGGLVYLMYNFAGMYDIFMLFIESIITSVMYIIFKKSKGLMQNRKKRAQTAQDELISISISVGVMITGLSGIIFPYNIELSNIVSVYAVLCIAMHSSLQAAGSGGLCIGFLASMSTPSAVVMMGIFGISALFANLLKAFGRFGVALGFLGGAAVALLYAGNSFNLPVTIIETAIGAVLFIVTPKKFRSFISAFFSQSLKIEALSTDVRVKEYLTMQLGNVSDAFKSLEECFETASQKRLKSYNKDVAYIFDEVADRVCENCPNAAKCWQNDFTRTYRSIMLLLDIIETKGILTLSAVPVSFRERCLRAELFIVEFNHVYELYKKNLVRMGEAVSSRDLVARQYSEISTLMDSIAQNISSGFLFREDLEESVVNELDKVGIIAFEVNIIEGSHGKMEAYLGVNKGMETGKIEKVLSEVLETNMAYCSEIAGGLMKFASCARYRADIGIRQINCDYTDVSGDSIDSFTTDDYKHYIIISDGMGSGRRAMTESHITLKLLRDFLMSGFGVHTAVDMINSALCLKLDYECFSTVDLLCADLMTGICEFYKIGGAESVVLHGANVETIFSVSLPVGMVQDIKIQSQTKRLSDGDTIIMMTDGVSEAGFGTARTNWLKKEIKMPFDTMDELAQSVIDTAVKKSHDSVMDDMTVAAIRLIEN